MGHSRVTRCPGLGSLSQCNYLSHSFLKNVSIRTINYVGILVTARTPRRLAEPDEGSVQCFSACIPPEEDICMVI